MHMGNDTRCCHLDLGLGRRPSTVASMVQEVLVQKRSDFDRRLL
jgi:hypothetical protein